MRGLVLVGVPVPVGSVGPPRLRLAHGRRSTRTRCGRWSSTRDPTATAAPVAAWGRGRRRPDPAGGRLVRADLPRRGRGRAVGGADLPARAGATTRRPRSTRRCCAWCAAWSRCPTSLEVRRGVAAADRPGLLVTSYLPGQRGDLLLPTLDDARRRPRSAPGSASWLADLAGHADPARRAVRRRRPAPSATSAVADGLPGFVDDHAAALGWDATC